MLRVVFYVFVSFGLLTNGINSLTVVNNVTVSSDFLSHVFFQEILKNNALLESPIIKFKEYDSNQCILDLREIIQRLPSLQVIPFIDAWGKLTSGILYGNSYSMGNFDQCVKASLDSNTDGHLINGQYCFATVPIISKETRNLPIPFDFEGQQQNERASLKNGLDINVAICVPSSCSSEFLTTLFQKAVSKVSNKGFTGITVSRCTNGKRPDLKPINIVGITIFSIIGALMIASSLYDFFTAYFQKPRIHVLLAFSVLTNGKKLFAINTIRSPNNIECLTGVRVITMLWIIYCHTFMTVRVLPIINKIEMYSWYRTFWSMPVLNGTISVDTFFFISGLLVAYLGFRELDKTNGKLNIVMMYVHRYIRLTPVVAAVLLYTLSINALMYNGTFRELFLSKNICNGNNWWPVLLYIQNYYPQVPRCFDTTWYLHVDFQLYILSPLLLIPMWKWGKKVSPVLLVLSLMSIASVMAVYINQGYTGLINGTNPDEWTKEYSLTHTRCSPWLIGFGFGYFMHVNRQKKFNLSRINQLLGWIACFAVFLSIIFGPYFTISKHLNGTVLEAALYEGWKRFSWAIAMGWLTFACHFGYGGIIDSFLSHPYWQPLSRLSFSLYLIHLTVVRMNFGMIRNAVYVSDYSMILEFWGAFGIALMYAIFLTLGFESPILVLEKFVFGREKSSSKEKKIRLEVQDHNMIVVA